MGYRIRTEKDIDKMLSGHTKLIVKKIEAITTEEDPEPGREFDLYLVEPTLPQDFKGFIQRLMMLVNEMGASDVFYNPGKNSLKVLYKYYN